MGGRERGGGVTKTVMLAMVLLLAVMAFNAFHFVYFFSLVPLLETSAGFVLLVGFTIGHQFRWGMKSYLILTASVMLTVACIYIVVQGAIVLRSLLMMGGMALFFILALAVGSKLEEKKD